MEARWVSFLTWPRGRQALLTALATLLGLAADARCDAANPPSAAPPLLTRAPRAPRSLSPHPRTAALLCAIAGLCLGAGLAQDAAAAQLDAAEAAEAAAYAPEVAAALTRRALPRAIAAAGALAGGAVAGGAAAVIATTPSSAASHAHSGAAGATPVVAGLCLMLAALLMQIYDARSLGREVAIANGTTPPGINASSNAPVRARVGVAAALACLAVAASLAGAGRIDLASLLADAVRERCSVHTHACRSDATHVPAGHRGRRRFRAARHAAGVA